VEYKDYGIMLKILPTVMEKDKVNVKVSADVSDITSSGQYTRSDGTTIPAFTTRTVTSELYLADDQTIIMGGLIKQKDEETLKRVPFLSKIPILGEFFKSTTTGGSSSSLPNEAKELVISITPKIIRVDEEEAETDILKEWEEKRAKDELPRSLIQASSGVFNYTLTVQKKINEGLYYPYGARAAGLEGIVKLSLHILSNGDLIDAVVRESSGYHVLDVAAIDAAKSQAPYPRFQADLKLKELWVDIPVVYRIGTRGNVQ
jgi:TonB family protein